MKSKKVSKKISRKKFEALNFYASQILDQRNRAIENLRKQTERAEKYFKRMQEVKMKISEIDLLLKFDNYTEEEAYIIPMDELRQLANDELNGKTKTNWK